MEETNLIMACASKVEHHCSFENRIVTLSMFRTSFRLYTVRRQRNEVKNTIIMLNYPSLSEEVEEALTGVCLPSLSVYMTVSISARECKNSSSSAMFKNE